MIYFLDIIIAYLLDLIFGDPVRIPHPVRFIGLLIKKTEELLRRHIALKASNKMAVERLCGILLCGIVVFTVFFMAYFILLIAGYINKYLFHIINIYILYTSIATKCLADEANKVYKKLDSGTLEEARESLSWLVGRDTSSLSEKGIIRGTIETTAENTVDAVISPLFYAFIGTLFALGAPVVYAFKAVSTLDSMIGYKNEKYRYFGTASARFDDILNFIPARLSIIIIPLAAGLLGFNGIRSFKIALRDRKMHLSPNSAHGESAVAGALGIKLGGPNIYFGKIVEKPYLGDELKLVDKKDIKDTIKIMYLTSFITVIICALLIFIINALLSMVNI